MSKTILKQGDCLELLTKIKKRKMIGCLMLLWEVEVRA